jgi:hypothetical protein
VDSSSKLLQIAEQNRIVLYSAPVLYDDEYRLVKRRKALRERNLPRNSQLETHR